MIQPLLGQAPMGFARWPSALDFALGEAKEIAVVGPSTSLRSAQDDVQRLLDVVFGEYRPNQVVAYAPEPTDSAVPLLAERPSLDGRATAYVCVNFVCQLPVTEPDALAAQLNG